MEQTSQTKNLTKKEKRLLKKQQVLEEQTKKTTQLKMIRIIRWVLLLFVAAAGVWFIKQTISTNSTSLPIPELTVVNNADHITGATESATLLVEYSDFQCPACSAFHPLVKRLLKEHGSQFTLVYRNFPLRQIHKNAQIAAQAAEAAGKQGKFWEMHDILFERQTEWSESKNPEEYFSKYASELGLKTDAFQQDIQSDDIKAKVNSDYTSGIRAKVNSTPTFYINGKKMETVKSYEEFRTKLGLTPQ